MIITCIVRADRMLHLPGRAVPRVGGTAVMTSVTLRGDHPLLLGDNDRSVLRGQIIESRSDRHDRGRVIAHVFICAVGDDLTGRDELDHAHTLRMSGS